MSIQKDQIDTNWKSSMIPIDITIKAWYNSYQNEEYELVKMEILLTSTKSFKQGITQNSFS